MADSEFQYSNGGGTQIKKSVFHQINILDLKWICKLIILTNFFNSSKSTLS